MKRGMVLKAVNGQDIRSQPYNIQLAAIDDGMDATSSNLILSFARELWPSEVSKYEPPSTSEQATDNPMHDSSENAS